ncbi:SMC family ATPase [Kocuria sp.]|uniref:AAA family ATPase n=1 Tax=Kocuria sp. TaxID=1871328 RepID=UPI0026DBC4F5|nr:SMC family ATPase [Kocuria sp.]MDO4918548.1 SMC family ATPase [Kocuria sp.]
MKLHHMEITAFGPFPGHEVIDFDALNDAGVFLLNGETGSGKTSVLDAICFALYGTGPTTAAKGGRKAGHSDHADPHTGPRVDLEFSAGDRRWHVSRTPAWREPSRRAASGWSERHATVLLRELVAGEWVERGYRPDDVGQMVHHAVGLDREQFTQVMMLPQGQFARFLQAGSKEREALLETLFGTDVYAEIQDELKARAHGARMELASAAEEAARSDELLARFQDRISRAAVQVSEEVGAQTWGESDSPPMSDTGATPAGHTEPVDGTQTEPEHTSAGAASEVPGHVSPAADDQEPAPWTWPDLVVECRELIERVGRARDGAATAYAKAGERWARQENLRGLLERHEELTRSRAELAREAERARTGEERLRRHTAAVELRDVVARAQDSDRQAASAREHLTGLRGRLAPGTEPGRLGRQVMGERQALLDALDGTAELPAGLRDAAVAARETARSVLVRARAVAQEETEAQREREQAQSLEEQAERTRSELEAARTEAAEAERTQRDLVDATRDEALIRDRARAAREAVQVSREHQRARAEESERSRAYEDAEAVRRAAARTVEELEAQRFTDAAVTLAGELADGQPCPVCGSTDHPQPASGRHGPEVTATVLQSAREERDRAQDAVDAAHEALRRAQRASTDTLGRGAEPDLDVVLGRERSARQAEEHLDEALKDLRSQEEELTTVRERVSALEAQATRVASDAVAARTRAETSSQRCVREREDLDRQLRGFANAADFMAAAEDLASAVSALDSAQHALDAAAQEARSAQTAVDRALAASPFDTADAVGEALLDADEAADLGAWLREREERWSALEAELATRDMQRAADLGPAERADLTAEALERTASETAAHERLRDRLTQQLGGLSELATEVESAAEQVPAQEAAHERVRERAERLSRLADVATATSSENALRMTLTSFVLAAKLEQVAAVASEHLSRMSSGRFTLVHTDQTRGGGKSGLGLEIDDSWTGVRRGTETLSGGESFFTSLALALALADVVRAEAGGQDIDTLFVDEGFGSLDEQTLEQVLETLDGLRRNGRVIGVVSHVSEMKQRIGTQLVVTKTPTGSHLSVTTGS